MTLYGVDMNKEVTPVDVRDAMVKCFFEAHCADSEMGGGEQQDESYCAAVVKKGFAESGGDFENPTKESIMAAMGYLQEFSKNFRDPKIIEKHAADIMKLVEKL